MKQLDSITEGWDAVADVFKLVSEGDSYHPTIQQFGVLRSDISKRVDVLIKQIDVAEEELQQWHAQWHEYRDAFDEAKPQRDAGYEEGEEDDDWDEDEDEDEESPPIKKAVKKKPGGKKGRSRLN